MATRATSARRTGARVTGAAVMVAGAMALRELARPRGSERARLIDWERVRRRAYSGAGQAMSPTASNWTELGRSYDRVAVEMRPWISEALGEPLHSDPFPAFQVVDREGWIDVNLALFKGMMDPVLELQEMLPASALTDLGRAGLSEYLGLLLGFLARRVLGQYDPVLLAPSGTANTS
ncbi:MAG: zinc-dependent metalloprotease, partial [Candidatus Dormibacteria bacterium]